MSRIIKPDYRGGGIVNLMASVAQRFGHRTGHPQLRGLPAAGLQNYKNIVLIVVDGMGHQFLHEHGRGSFLLGRLAARMTSVFPSTTASAVTTFATGAAPAEHGITGWFTYLRELGVVAKVLFSQPRYGSQPFGGDGLSMSAFIRARNIFDSLKAQAFIITPDKIAQGDFSRATSGRAVVLGYQGLVGFNLNIQRALDVGRREKFISAYWSEIDHLCHLHGVASPEVRDHFRLLDRTLERLCRKNADGKTLFLITADHGLVDTPAHRLIDLDDHPRLSECLALPLCGEPRVAYCYLHSDRAGQFRNYIQGRLKGTCRIYSRQQLLKGGFYGTGRSEPWFRSRIGDAVLVMEDGWWIKDYLMTEERVLLRANHGGMTPEEMYVPLVVVA